MDRENETPTDHYDPLGYRFTLSIPDAGVRAVAARMLPVFASTRMTVWRLRRGMS